MKSAVNDPALSSLLLRVMVQEKTMHDAWQMKSEDWESEQTERFIRRANELQESIYLWPIEC